MVQHAGRGTALCTYREHSARAKRGAVVTDSANWEPGKAVCVIGYGTSSLYHDHTKVARYTPRGIMVLENGLRFRSGGARDWKVIPYMPYGGKDVKDTCQRPVKKKTDQA
jgi:hypothetical protein